MSIFFEMAGQQAELSSADLQQGLFRALEKLGPRTRILAIPPDISRFHSRAGELTLHAHKYFGDKLHAVLPALGTHSGCLLNRLQRCSAKLLCRFSAPTTGVRMQSLSEMPRPSTSASNPKES